MIAFCHVWLEVTVGPVEDGGQIERELRRARRRLESATPYSPEWDAAMAAVEELERRLLAVRVATVTPAVTSAAASAGA